jgi:hypothetical protein
MAGLSWRTCHAERLRFARLNPNVVETADSELVGEWWVDKCASLLYIKSSDYAENCECPRDWHSPRHVSCQQVQRH